MKSSQPACSDIVRYSGLRIDKKGDKFMFVGQIQVAPSYNKFQVNKFSISRFRDARDTIAVGQQGQVL